MRTAGKKVKVGCGGFAYCIWRVLQHSSSGQCSVPYSPTAMTRLSPSKTSRSFRLSSSFLICCAGIGRDGLRGPTSLAASRVRSRASTSQHRSQRSGMKELPVSSSPLMRDIDSIATAGGRSVCYLRSGCGRMCRSSAIETSNIIARQRGAANAGEMMAPPARQAVNRLDRSETCILNITCLHP